MVSRATAASGRLPIGQLAFATRTRQNRNRPPFRLPPEPRKRNLEGMTRARVRSLARLKKNFNGHRIPDALLKVISHSPKGQDTRRSVVPSPPPSPLIRFLATFPIFSSSFENDPSFVRESLFLLRVLSRKSKRETESKRDWKSAWLEFSR